MNRDEIILLCAKEIFYKRKVYEDKLANELGDVPVSYGWNDVSAEKQTQFIEEAAAVISIWERLGG